MWEKRASVEILGLRKISLGKNEKRDQKLFMFKFFNRYWRIFNSRMTRRVACIENQERSIFECLKAKDEKIKLRTILKMCFAWIERRQVTENRRLMTQVEKCDVLSDSNLSAHVVWWYLSRQKCNNLKKTVRILKRKSLIPFRGKTPTFSCDNL